MKPTKWTHRAVVSLILLPNLLLSTTSAAAQDLVPTGSLGGGSSVFVFRSAARQVIKRFVPAAKPTRTLAQRLDTVRKIKKQYETVAKTTQPINRAKVVEPNKLNPTLPPAQASKLFAGVGEYYLAKNDYEKSFEYFEEAIKLDDTNKDAKNGYAEALATKGNDLLERDKAAEAKGVFLDALKYNPNNIAANFGLGGVYSELDQQADAIKAYEKSLEIGKDLTEIYVPLGILYYQTGEIAKADDMLTKAIAASPNTAETQYFLGLVRTSQNKLDEALAAFQKARTLDPTYADAYFQAAETLVKLKRTAEAIPDYEKAATLKPTDFDALLGWGQALSQAGKYAEAIPAFKKAKSLKNNNWEVYAGLGEAYRQTNALDEAISNFNLVGNFYTPEKVKDYDKEVAADFYSKIGFMYGQQCAINTAKNVSCPWPAAITALEKAVELANNPLDEANLGWAYYNAARSDLNIGDKVNGNQKLALAKDHLQKAIAANPNQVVVDGALQNLGAAQNDMGDFAGAVESLKGVAERHPEWVFSQYALATAYFKVNDFNNAAKFFNAAIAKEPKYVAAIHSLGLTQIKLKNKSEVRRIIDLLKTLDPGEAARLEAQAKLAKMI